MIFTFIIKVTISILFILLIIGVIQSRRLESSKEEFNNCNSTKVKEVKENVEGFDSDFLKFDNN